MNSNPNIAVDVVTIFFKVVSTLLLLYLILPKQLKGIPEETDGLRRLRLQLLFIGLTMLAANLFGITFISLHIFYLIAPTDLNSLLELTNGVAFLLIVLNLWIIYSSDYK